MIISPGGHEGEVKRTDRDDFRIYWGQRDRNRPAQDETTAQDLPWRSLLEAVLTVISGTGDVAARRAGQARVVLHLIVRLVMQ